MRSRRIWPILLLLATCLATCDAADSDLGRACPVPRDYDRAALDRVADELDRLPAGAELRQFMADYETLRRQARDCWEK